MARIPVAPIPVVVRPDDERERKGGLPLWVWPLIPLLLGALALGMSLRDDGTDRTLTSSTPGTASGNTQGATTNDAQPAGNALTDMLTIADADDQTTYAGQPASFANVTVQSVVGDRGFWIGPNARRQLFVVIDEANAGKSEGAVQIVPGQKLTLNGQIEKLPALDQAPDEWGLDASSSQALANQQVYLHATQVVAGQ